MVTVEQVRQLETRVAKAIDYVNKVTDENTLLKNKLDSYQKRIDELEVLIQRFKEEQGRIEEGIISALERLNRFEDDVHKTITPEDIPPKTDEAATVEPSPRTDSGAGEAPSPTPAAPAQTEIECLESNGDSADETSELDIF